MKQLASSQAVQSPSLCVIPAQAAVQQVSFPRKQEPRLLCVRPFVSFPPPVSFLRKPEKVSFLRKQESSRCHSRFRGNDTQGWAKTPLPTAGKAGQSRDR